MCWRLGPQGDVAGGSVDFQNVPKGNCESVVHLVSQIFFSWIMTGVDPIVYFFRMYCCGRGGKQLAMWPCIGIPRAFSPCINFFFISCGMCVHECMNVYMPQRMCRGQRPVSWVSSFSVGFTLRIVELQLRWTSWWQVPFLIEVSHWFSNLFFSQANCLWCLIIVTEIWVTQRPLHFKELKDASCASWCGQGWRVGGIRPYVLWPSLKVYLCCTIVQPSSSMSPHNVIKTHIPWQVTGFLLRDLVRMNLRMCSWPPSRWNPFVLLDGLLIHWLW